MSKGSPLALAARGIAVVVLLLTAGLAAAARPAEPLHRYIVEFPDPPLALYDGRELAAAARGGPRRLAATAPQFTGDSGLDRGSDAALAYLEYIAARHEEFRLEAARTLGRPVTPVHRYRAATNGMALDLTEAEAAELARSTLLQSITRDTRHRLDTDAGPEWIGAGDIWNGLAGYPQARGENIVIGVIDSGINWEHPSFSDPSGDGYDHANP
ncbi:MAG: hypothetical protein EHM68_16460, partial [Lysobacterales bacterium]